MNFTLLLWASLCAQNAGLGEWVSEKPEALIACENGRNAIRTADIEWSVLRVSGSPPKRHYYQTRIAGSDFVLVDRGDENGAIAFRMVNGESVPVVGTERYLRSGEEVWDYVDGDLGVRVRPIASAHGLPDPRNIGLQLSLRLDKPWDQYLAVSRKPGEQRFRVDKEGDIHIVSMRYENEPALVTRWRLDGTKGFQPVSCERLVDGMLRRAVHTTYEQCANGEWFPVLAEYMLPNGTVYRRIEVASARINEPDLPLRLSPEHIGIGNGINVDYCAPHPKHAELEIFCEGQAIPVDEFLDRQSAVGVKPCDLFAEKFPSLVEHYEAVLAARRTRDAGGSAVAEQGQTVAHSKTSASQPAKRGPGCPSEWEQYTLDFIARYQLNEQQTQMALSILKSCQDRGDAYVAKHRRQFERLDERVKALRELDGEQRRKAEAQVKSDRAKLLGPLDEIFEQQLKPRLERLPTRAQRQAAGEGQGERGAGKEGEESKEKP